MWAIHHMFSWKNEFQSEIVWLKGCDIGFSWSKQSVCCENLDFLFHQSNWLAAHTRGAPNKRGGWADFFIYYMKNRGEGFFFHLLQDKQGEGGIIFWN